MIVKLGLIIFSTCYLACNNGKEAKPVRKDSSAGEPVLDMLRWRTVWIQVTPAGQPIDNQVPYAQSPLATSDAGFG